MGPGGRSNGRHLRPDRPRGTVVRRTGGGRAGRVRGAGRAWDPSAVPVDGATLPGGGGRGKPGSLYAGGRAVRVPPSPPGGRSGERQPGRGRGSIRRRRDGGGVGGGSLLVRAPRIVRGNAARRARGSRVRVRADGRHGGGWPLSAADPGCGRARLRACALRLRARGLLSALPGHAVEKRCDRVRIAIGLHRPIPACWRRGRHGRPHEEASGHLASGPRLGRHHRGPARLGGHEHPPAQLDELRPRRLDPDVPGPATGPWRARPPPSALRCSR